MTKQRIYSNCDKTCLLGDMFYGRNIKDGDGFELFVLVMFFRHYTSFAVLDC
jgi:hypothetical protein